MTHFCMETTQRAPTIMTTAIGDMETAYTDAAGRVTPDYLDLYTGAIGGLSLLPGLYKWNSSVSVLSDVTLLGGPDDVWIFQISGDLAVSDSFKVLLSGGARAKNIFWQVTGTATMNGRALAQTQVALDQATVVQPAL